MVLGVLEASMQYKNMGGKAIIAVVIIIITTTLVFRLHLLFQTFFPYAFLVLMMCQTLS